MFDKLKSAFSKFGKKAEEEAIPDAPVADIKEIEEQPKEKKFKLFQKKEKPEIKEEKPKKEKFKLFKKKEAEPKEKAKEEHKAEKRGLFQRITEVKLSEDKFNSLFDDFENELLQNNVAYEVVDAIRSDLKKAIVDKNLKRGKLDEAIQEALKGTITRILTEPKQIDLIEKAKESKARGKPLTIMFIGTNGHGKTTTLAKVASYLKGEGYSCIFAASDTFRSGAEQQLQEHADKLKIKMVKHQHGADPAAVAFDAQKNAESKSINIVLIDTAGRQHSNVNLMDELKKIKRVVKPSLTIFVGESITGNDCVNQAESFNEAVPVDGIILTKIDVDERGGTPLSISYVLKKPILFLGVGQRYEDLEKFDADRFVKQILS